MTKIEVVLNPRQISQTSVIFFLNSQNGVFFILFPDMGKSCRDYTLSLWI